MRCRLILVVFAAIGCLVAGCTSGRRVSPQGWYFVGSKLNDDEAPGGFGPCDNLPKDCADNEPGRAGQLALIAYPGEIVEFNERKWLRLRLVNRTEKVVAFSACDSQLFLVEEALDRDGRWRTLERFPESICGNSFHRVFLEPEQYWDLSALPREGSFKTKLRFRLEKGDKAIAEGAGTIYSNEFDGSISRSSFVAD
jgi:hypothetical protein